MTYTSLGDTYFIDDALSAIDGHRPAPMSDESYLIGSIGFPLLLWGLLTGNTG